MHVCTCVFVCVYVRMYVCMYVRMYVYIDYWLLSADSLVVVALDSCPGGTGSSPGRYNHNNWHYPVQPGVEYRCASHISFQLR